MMLILEVFYFISFEKLHINRLTGRRVHIFLLRPSIKCFGRSIELFNSFRCFFTCDRCTLGCIEQGLGLLLLTLLFVLIYNLIVLFRDLLLNLKLRCFGHL